VAAILGCGQKQVNEGMHEGMHARLPEDSAAWSAFPSARLTILDSNSEAAYVQYLL
jgi:hypothetical protein